MYAHESKPCLKTKRPADPPFPQPKAGFEGFMLQLTSRVHGPPKKDPNLVLATKMVQPQQVYKGPAAWEASVATVDLRPAAWLGPHRADRPRRGDRFAGAGSCGLGSWPAWLAKMLGTLGNPHVNVLHVMVSARSWQGSG